MQNLIYVVADDDDDLAYLKSFDDFDDAVIITGPAQIQGRRFFAGDRIIIGLVGLDDERLAIMRQSLALSSFWFSPTAFSDITLNAPKVRSL
jgi:hypothetical protein